MEDPAIINARYRGIAAAVAALACGDPTSVKIPGGLSISEAETASLVLRRLGVSLADLELSRAAANDLDIIRQAFARLDEWYSQPPPVRITAAKAEFRRFARFSRKGPFRPFPATVVSDMPRQKKDPEHMTAEEELRSLLKWAEQTNHENVATALRRVLAKLSRKGSATL
ncbi:MAG: hypothetical protein JWO80_2211 [Bryobacterales bacterium]|nr:hypothetical protein [Bryobacterales bacterium]